MKENLYEIIIDFSKEKGLDHEIVKKLVEQSLIQAAQRKLPYREIEGQIDEKTGNINLYHFKEVVDLVEDSNNEISVEDVFEIDPDAGIGDEVEYEISDREFQRIAHSTRPIIFGSLKEAERQMVVSTFTEKIGEVLTGTVLRVEPNGRVALSFQNKVEAYLFRREQIYGENFTFGDHVRVLLMDVNDNPHKDSQLTISRTHPGLLIKLFEMEVPEIYDGIVKIVSASREPGRRAKISVYSTDEEVDPVGSCVGMRGSRVQTIVNDLHGEKIDIVRWSEDIDVYTCNALAPAEIDSLEIDEDEKQIDVVVAPNQLSLAIGHKGQNVRLASKLIGYKINIVASEEEDLSIDEQLEKELAKSSEDGKGKKQTGKRGENLYLKVPIGTQVLEEDNKTLIYDFKKQNEEFVVAIGGRGGIGNTRFKSSTNRAPRKFTKGLKGEEFWIWLQLKTIADIGIIGLPNAGKSSLLASVTRANPKIANYKFTTINPNLGVAIYDDKEITLADIPGLIEGAHSGIGLGTKFLKHIERCKTLLHLIDINEKDLSNSYRQVREELRKYSKELLKKKELIVFNKIDLVDKKILEEKINKFTKKNKKKVFTLSTINKLSVSQIKSKLINYAS